MLFDMANRRRALLAMTGAAAVVLCSCGTTNESAGVDATKAEAQRTAPNGKKKDQPSASTSETDIPNATALKEVDDRTSAVVITEDEVFATKNATEARPGLSVLKLYIADYALRKGEISDEDFALAKRMITSSDDFAADVLYQKYPQSIDWVAEDYGLKDTSSSTSWGSALTSAYDVATYLDKVKRERPNSYILRWMTSPQEVAADGTKQIWGTAQLPTAEGTKWGWSDFGKKSVASATVGRDFTAAAFTWGSAKMQNRDIKKILPQIGA